jgi:AmmeMemoRadiSam system protein A
MMTENQLTEQEQLLLLSLARKVLVAAICRQPFEHPDPDTLPPRLVECRSSFVTLMYHGELRGCIGALEACKPLVQDVCEHVVLAATEDFRFHPVKPSELADLVIEISCLTPSTRLDYEEPEELLTLIRPGIDGVTFRLGQQRATFLPQVWEKLPRAEDFFDHLANKMGSPEDLWRRIPLDVYTYQVQSFEESHPPLTA